MSVSPYRLQGVPPYPGEAHQSKSFHRERPIRAFVQIAHDVHLPLAAGTGTMPAQLLQGNKGLRSIIPLERQFVANLLNIRRLHREILAPNDRRTIPRLELRFG